MVSEFVGGGSRNHTLPLPTSSYCHPPNCSMKQKLARQDIGFTQVKNEVLNHKKLSFKAKGLFAYIYSKPDGWDFAVERIALDGTDGDDSVATGIRELEKLNYLVRTRKPSGKVVYNIYYEPKVDNPLRAKKPATTPKRENPKRGKSPTGKIGVISNKDLLVTKKDNQSKKILKKLNAEQVAWVIKKFNSITGKNSRVFPKQAQSSLVRKLNQGYNIVDLLDVIKRAYKDPHHVEHNYRYITLEYVTREKPFERYYNAGEATTAPKPKYIPDAQQTQQYIKNITKDEAEADTGGLTFKEVIKKKTNM